MGINCNEKPTCTQQIDLSHLDVVEKAKLIRRELKKRFPNVPFCVRTERYSLGESIDIMWIDGPSDEEFEAAQVRRYEHVDRDEFSGEILAGGNSYVHWHRYITPQQRQKVEDEIWERFVEGTWKDRNEYGFHVEVARALKVKSLPILGIVRHLKPNEYWRAER